jgi:hypothetical protein
MLNRSFHCEPYIWNEHAITICNIMDTFLQFITEYNNETGRVCVVFHMTAL